MQPVNIKKNSIGDTRTATRVPDFGEFQDSNRMHRYDVEMMMRNLADDIRNVGCNHDWTKSQEPYRSMFYRELCNTIEGRMDFDDGEWFDIHCNEERHHLLRRCPEDVNLIDVLEMICDCVCAGMARSGKFREFKLPDDILQKAVQNTVQMCLNAAVLEEVE